MLNHTPQITSLQLSAAFQYPAFNFQNPDGDKFCNGIGIIFIDNKIEHARMHDATLARKHSLSHK